MTDQFFAEWLEKAKKVAVEAGEKILEVYNSDSFGEEIKADKSPLTKADKESHNAIVAVLDQSELPVLSEEGKDITYEERKAWEYFWMVDPLDGTKEFIKRNGEYDSKTLEAREGAAKQASQAKCVHAYRSLSHLSHSR